MAEIVMTEKAREARREYYRRWRKENPDRVASAQARFWEKRARQIAEEAEKAEGRQKGGAYGE